MDGAQQRDGEQALLWNGSSGRAWIEMQDVIDTMFRRFENLLAGAVSAAGASEVLEVGCGTGGLTLAIARQLEAGGRCTGIDISEAMIAMARERAARESARASFVCADAQGHVFDRASFDMIISRFGVMFFEDPVMAFANLRRATRVDAELRFVAWRDAAENSFMTAAERAAAPLLPSLPPRRPDAPGQFGFADRHRVRAILEQGGWAEIDIRPIDVACSFAENELVRYLTWLGPVGRVLQDADEQTRAQVVDKVRGAFDPFVVGDEVSFTAACWMVRARAPAG
ncbi:class I SAM-dependent methyltransferase [Bradyrhizobium lablabi]|uniref:class I SAM-dependent methyltransferase n=1 Tax=Bradyrhizobium lablabi TaxID=722472 RepID=UPI001BA753F8|nr:class I SAM-dependent methyltransferase [Bradyrhizobium lablabi]MBR1123587.1 class I SAM-dependent methyltransferase [Bradyrhizobium lablabi]